MKEFLCETQELAIGYGKTPLASGIALRAKPGQILVLVGPNGAGKSTLLKTLAGQLAPLGGTVLLDGQDLTAYTGTARAQKLALMLPHTRRTELTTCFEFAAAGRIPYTGRLGILSDADRQAVQDALEIAGAAHLADRDFNCISDGQRQRVLLARAICQQPKVLLLDEPTSFLDIKGKIELLTILQLLPAADVVLERGLLRFCLPEQGRVLRFAQRVEGTDIVRGKGGIRGQHAGNMVREHAHHCVRDLLCHVQLMQAHDDRKALFMGQLLQDGQQLDLALDVQKGGGLVQ